MLGAIAGDVIGSVHEHLGTKSMDFELFAPECRFTDDTVLTVAVADCLLNGFDYIDAFHEYFLAYPTAGYGYNFFHWASSGDRRPYNGAMGPQCGCPQSVMRLIDWRKFSPTLRAAQK
jgi:ADP-ribosylglycohydrolase